MNGSKLTAVQVAVAPNASMAGSIPLQPVEGDPAVDSGAMQGVTYTHRVDTRGGVAPAMPCAAGNLNAKQIVKYRADDNFYKAMQAYFHFNRIFIPDRGSESGTGSARNDQRIEIEMKQAFAYFFPGKLALELLLMVSGQL